MLRKLYLFRGLIGKVNDRRGKIEDAGERRHGGCCGDDDGEP